jgi:hypothetical protein
MEPAKDLTKVKQMFAMGQPFLLDSQTGYKYSMVALCPGDASYASVAQIEKEGQALTKVVFQCPSCFKQFEAKQDDIYVY